MCLVSVVLSQLPKHYIVSNAVSMHCKKESCVNIFCGSVKRMFELWQMRLLHVYRTKMTKKCYCSNERP